MTDAKIAKIIDKYTGLSEISDAEQFAEVKRAIEAAVSVALSETQSALAFAQTEIVTATEKYEEAVIDRNDTDTVLDKLRDILHRTAIALKGKEPPLTRHSFHDLPELAGLAKELAAQAMDTIREKEAYAENLVGLLKECMEVADNWPGVAYTADLEKRVSEALGGWERTFTYSDNAKPNPVFTSPTPEQLQELCERLWDTDESDPVLSISKDTLRRIYAVALFVTQGCHEIVHCSTCNGLGELPPRSNDPEDSTPAPPCPDCQQGHAVFPKQAGEAVNRYGDKYAVDATGKALPYTDEELEDRRRFAEKGTSEDRYLSTIDALRGCHSQVSKSGGGQ